MLSHINPDKTLDKKVYKDALEKLEDKLAALQLAIRDAGVPVAIVFEGWSASGKGTCISRLVNPLDPRYFNVYSMEKITEDMKLRPFLQSFWIRTPAKGRFVFLDKGWHRLTLPGVRGKWDLKESVEEHFYEDVLNFERQLTDDGTLIVKIFLHISKEEQHERFRELEKNHDTAWRVNQNDREQNRDYEHHMHHYEKMLEATETEANPWHIVEANDNKYATVKIFSILIRSIEERINTEFKPPAETPCPLPIVPVLRNINPEVDIPESKYKKDLQHYQQQLNELGYKLYVKRRPVVIVYEGWDAAGKGGNIKRLIEGLDPRCYEVVPIAAPSVTEHSYNYLWRFYNKFPKDGHITVFDRSWYGRVLVERVENLTPAGIWERAYREINEMESHLYNHGAVILKFWLHISQDEQLKRFHDRQDDPLKQYKITYDDWRNRDKWPMYELAADEMLNRTDSDYAPWTVVEANSKKFARLKVLKTVVEALEKALD